MVEQEGVGHDELHQLENCEDVVNGGLCHREQQGVLHNGLHQHEHGEEVLQEHEHYAENQKDELCEPLPLHEQGLLGPMSAS